MSEHPAIQPEIKPAPQPKAPKRSRARNGFRLAAEMLNPSPFIQVLDGRGRPRRSPRHTNVKA